MRRIVQYLFVLSLAVGAAGGGVTPAAAVGSRAEEVMKQARVAMGGEEKLRGVQSLSFKGKFRRVVQEREMSGEREFELLLPDKFSRTESFLAGGSTASITSSQTLSGAESWSSG